MSKETFLAKTIATPEYDFLRENPHLGKTIMFLTLSGSHAYGTNVEGSDVDIRGCETLTADELLGTKSFDVYTNTETDTTVFGSKKLLGLLAEGAPSALSLLYGEPDTFAMVSEAGQLLLDNRDIFLSKQLYKVYEGCAISMEKELYKKFEKANRHPGLCETDQKLINKHMMHLVRMMMEGIDALSGRGPIPRREGKQLETLMKIRNGEYSDFVSEGKGATREYWRLVNQLHLALGHAWETSSLPDVVDMDKVNKLSIDIHRLALARE